MNKIFNLFGLDRNKFLYFFILFFEKSTLIFSHIYFINFLNKDLYGLYNQINFLSNVIVNISLFGTLVPIVLKSKKIKEYDYNKVINSISIFFIIILMLLSIIFFLFRIDISVIVFGGKNYSNYLYILFLVAILDLFSEIFIQKSRITENLVEYSTFILKRTLIRLISLFIIYKLTDSFILSILISTTFYFILIFRKIKINFSDGLEFIKSKRGIVKKIFQEGSSFLAMFLLTILNTYIINFILAYKFKLDNLAIYNFNYSLATFPITFINYIIFYSLPKFNDSDFRKKQIIISTLKDIFFAGSILLLSYLILNYLYTDLISLIAKDSSFNNISLFRKIYLLNIVITLNTFIQFPLYKSRSYFRIVLIQFAGLIFTTILLYFSQKTELTFPINSVIISNFGMLVLYLLHLIFNAKIFKESYN